MRREGRLPAPPLPWSAPPARPLLPAGEIHVWAFALDPPARRLSELERLLSREEAERASRFRYAPGHRRFVVGRAQLREILGRYLGRDGPTLELCYGSHGKPALQRGSDDERVRFNMSRSHELGVLAVQLDDELGIDVERVRPFPDALDVAQRFFAPEEHAALRSLPAAERDAAFFSYWTRKEAVIKSIGLGLSQPLASFRVTPDTGASPAAVVVASGDGVATRWLLPLPPPAAGYIAALATAGSPRPLRCWTWADP